MNRGKKLMWMAAGILAGAAITGPAAQAVQDYLQAVPSTQTFYLDGARVYPEAYSIADHNYLQLAEISQLLGVEVRYQVSDNSVRISTQAGSQTPDAETVPADGSRYVPRAGDIIPCDDGSTYTITDVSRWGLDPFYPDGKLPSALPTPTCDWSGFAQPELPAVEVRHFQNPSGDMLFVRNLYETQRMQYTLYNLIGQAGSDAAVSLTIDWETGVGEFWPWRESEVEKLFYSNPDGHYHVEAWDIYKDGVYQNTRYRIDVT